MQIKSFLNRFKLAEPSFSSVKHSAPSAKLDKLSPIQKSELTTLFKNVLEEKQDDLPIRRK